MLRIGNSVWLSVSLEGRDFLLILANTVSIGIHIQLCITGLLSGHEQQRLSVGIYVVCIVPYSLIRHALAVRGRCLFCR